MCSNMAANDVTVRYRPKFRGNPGRRRVTEPGREHMLLCCSDLSDPPLSLQAGVTVLCRLADV